MNMVSLLRCGARVRFGVQFEGYALGGLKRGPLLPDGGFERPEFPDRNAKLYAPAHFRPAVAWNFDASRYFTVWRCSQ